MPIWLAARWPNKRPVARALRHDGVFLIDTDDPASLAGIVADAAALGRPFDVVIDHNADEPVDVAAWAAAGATWLLTTFDPFTATVAGAEAVIQAGPPD
jgi:hypothetical protein